MNIRKTNEMFGYGFFMVGALKILLVVLVLVRLTTNLSSIFNSGNINSEYYPSFSMAIGYAQLILAFGSIIMIIVNIRKHPQVIPGYLWGLGALLIEFIIPPIMSFFTIFAECGMYMKAGSKIRNKNLSYEKEHNTTKNTIKNTEWFYSNSNIKNEQINQAMIQDEKRKAKLQNELDGWKQLLDSGEIDEETYNQETNKLIEKEKKKSERMRRF